MAALTTEKVLQDEAAAICNVDLSGHSGTDLYRELNKLNRAALCLSGGGIRSAAFALGVIQALAAHPRRPNGDIVERAEDSLLTKFHYLSTVSGGGYIGSWLSAWLMHCYSTGPGHWSAIWGPLVKRADPNQEPRELSWLRRFSNYLTPKLGIASADFWAALALCIRNLLLNWFILIPILCAALLILKLVALAVAWVSQFDPQSSGLPFAALAVLAAGLMIAALRFTTRQRPTRGASDARQSAFLYSDLGPAFLAAILFVLAVASPQAETFVHENFWPEAGLPWLGLATAAGGGLIIYAGGWALGFKRGSRRTDVLTDLLAWSISGAIYGVLILIGLYLYFRLPDEGPWPFQPKEVLLIAAGPPWMLVAKLVGEVIFTGLTSYEDGSDSDREWLGRASGWYLVAALAWLILICLVFVGSKLLRHTYVEVTTWLVGGGASILTGWLGSSRSTPAVGAAKTRWGLSANVVLAIAAPLVVIVLIVLASALLDRAMFGYSLIDTAGFHRTVVLSGVPSWPGGIVVPLALAIALGIAAVASYVLNVNRFSLHALYRNRIIRAFLGASNPTRRPNPFTDFDENDNLRIYDLWPKEIEPNQWPPRSPATWRPFHIINIALNVTSTKNLAWQERKAEPFSVSALHCGSSYLGYRYSTQYGDSLGVTLGTAVAISGAAASPNMGYHSSPPLALLLTLFNVRMGWWLGNPCNERTYKNDGPLIAAGPLLNEMFGRTTDDRPYVYLSDGGHFENLGLYEMVRRRCRFIIVSDAGSDANFAFEDLGNAVRKIGIDLGVPIRFRALDKLKKRPEDGDLGPDAPYHAVADIDYAAVDGGGGKGHLLYIKAGYHGVESADIRAYAIANSMFPYESTGDQCFSESQFESYRKLGFEITDGLLRTAFATRMPGDLSLQALFDGIG
jgi:hypothetical protein